MHHNCLQRSSAARAALDVGVSWVRVVIHLGVVQLILKSFFYRVIIRHPSKATKVTVLIDLRSTF